MYIVITNWKKNTFYTNSEEKIVHAYSLIYPTWSANVIAWKLKAVWYLDLDLVCTFTYFQNG